LLDRGNALLDAQASEILPVDLLGFFEAVRSAQDSLDHGRNLGIAPPLGQADRRGSLGLADRVAWQAGPAQHFVDAA
jgi:hypothetical protein